MLKLYTISIILPIISIILLYIRGLIYKKEIKEIKAVSSNSDSKTSDILLRVIILTFIPIVNIIFSIMLVIVVLSPEEKFLNLF